MAASTTMTFVGEGETPADYTRFGEIANLTSPEAKAERRTILRRNPDLALQLGEMARHMEDSLIDDLGGLIREGLPEKCRDMRRRLGYKEGSELERLLIDRIVLTWLHVQRAEQDRRVVRNGVSLAKAAFLHKEASRALLDHTRAVTALARVRRLLRPAVAQVNIAAAGGQQVNVAAALMDATQN